MLIIYYIIIIWLYVECRSWNPDIYQLAYTNMINKRHFKRVLDCCMLSPTIISKFRKSKKKSISQKIWKILKYPGILKVRKCHWNEMRQMPLSDHFHPYASILGNVLEDKLLTHFQFLRINSIIQIPNDQIVLSI
jgi:hypothetical protein